MTLVRHWIPVTAPHHTPYLVQDSVRLIVPLISTLSTFGEESCKMVRLQAGMQAAKRGTNFLAGGNYQRCADRKWLEIGLLNYDCGYVVLLERGC